VEHSPHAKRATQNGYLIHARRSSRVHTRESESRYSREELATSAILNGTDPSATPGDLGLADGFLGGQNAGEGAGSTGFSPNEASGLPQDTSETQSMSSISDSLFNYDASGLRIRSIELRNCRPSTATLVLHMEYHYGDAVEKAHAILMTRPPLEIVENLIDRKLIDASTDRMGLAEQIRQKIEEARKAMASSAPGGGMTQQGMGSVSDVSQRSHDPALNAVVATGSTGSTTATTATTALGASKLPRMQKRDSQVFESMETVPISSSLQGTPREESSPPRASANGDAAEPRELTLAPDR